MLNKMESSFHKQFLLGKGFSFGVHTHVAAFEGKNQYAVYHFIVIPIENDQIKIVKND